MPTTSKALQRQLELHKMFRMAIVAEQRAQQMYKDAMAKCDDAELKSVLSSLREDEIRHEKEMKAMYRELKRLIDIEESVAPKSAFATRGNVKRKTPKKNRAT